MKCFARVDLLHCFVAHRGAKIALGLNCRARAIADYDQVDALVTGPSSGLDQITTFLEYLGQESFEIDASHLAPLTS